MDINILSQNIANNPEDFSAEKIKNYFIQYGMIKFEEAVDLCKQAVCYEEEASSRIIVSLIQNVKHEFKK